MQWADEVFLSCILETCMVLQTNVTPIYSINNIFEMVFFKDCAGSIAKLLSSFKWAIRITTDEIKSMS